MDIYEFNRTFKRGDILRIRDWLLIYYSADESVFNGYHAIAYIALWHMYNYGQISIPGHPSYGIGYVETNDNKGARHANNAEKEIMYRELGKRGYRWDEETRELVKEPPVVITIDARR